MKIYHYNEQGEFTGESKAEQNPLDADDFLIPANATASKPRKGENVFKRGSWHKVVDHRGKKVYHEVSGEIVTVDYLGELKNIHSLKQPAANIELLKKEARARRNSLLSATDFYLLPDVKTPGSVTEYRQALRDVTKQKGFPMEISWPLLQV